ncbi:MAG: rRNA pseudouridine synthase [Clostridia bacterium]|nr:rRNA pseudouridine synthase [Clostridia bacterium]
MDSKRGKIVSVRLESYLFRSDVGTYEDVAAFLKAERVKVNGVLQTDSNFRVSPAHDFVELDEKPLNYRRYAYLIMNKPAGYVSANSSRHYKTVMDILPEWCRRRQMKPVNSLDKDMSGLVLVTDDEGLSRTLETHTKYNEVVYHVQMDKSPAIKNADSFASGIHMKYFVGGVATLTKAESYFKDEFACRLASRECRYNDIVRMFLAIGIKVFSVELLTFGGLVLPVELVQGMWRELNSSEYEVLKLQNPYI